VNIGDLLQIKRVGSCNGWRRCVAMEFIGPVVLIIGFPPDGHSVCILAGERAQAVNGTYLRELYETISL